MFYYLLLYKLKSSPLLWIVKRELDYNNIFENSKKLISLDQYISNTDEYYIIKQKTYTVNEFYNLPQLPMFSIFKLDKNSELILQT